MSKWLDLKISVEIQVSPITDNEKDTKYKLDLTISAIIVLSVSHSTSCEVSHSLYTFPVFFKHRGIVDCRHSAKVKGSAT